MNSDSELIFAVVGGGDVRCFFIFTLQIRVMCLQSGAVTVTSAVMYSNAPGARCIMALLFKICPGVYSNAKLKGRVSLLRSRSISAGKKCKYIL